MKRWRCGVCGYVHTGDSPPEKCPNCGAEFLLSKRDKSGQTVLFCNRKECGYEEQQQGEESAAAGLSG